MTYEVIYLKAAKKVYDKLQPKLRQRIKQKLDHIAQDPYGEHNEVTKLQGREGYRLRVGDWRILYSLENRQLKLITFDIKPRGQAYKH